MFFQQIKVFNSEMEKVAKSNIEKSGLSFIVPDLVYKL